MDLQLERDTSSYQREREISSLKTEILDLQQSCNLYATRNEQLTMANNHLELMIDQTKATLQAQSQELLSQSLSQQLLSIRQDQEDIETKAYQTGVSDGLKLQAKKQQQTIDLPPKLNHTNLAEFVKDAFKQVHKRKPPEKCAAIAAAAVWNLYDGKCRTLLKEWTTELIRQENPYRKAE